jgi:tetratricopeptide (TPR) repeat protein
LSAAAVLCFVCGAWGQVPEADSVKGELHVVSSGILRLEVTLTALHGGLPVAQASVGADGRFEFRHVPLGDYRLAVFDSPDQPLHVELLSVHEQMQPIRIEVAPREAPRPAGGTVSAQELRDPPAKKAVQACLAGQKLADAGEREKAAEQFEKAVKLSPGYTTAWINLAAQHLYLKRYEQALQELTQAAGISRPSALICANMAYAQIALHRYGEAIGSAREALRLDPSSTQAHFLLGSVLVLDGRTRAEGIRHLEAAAPTNPSAREELELVTRESAQAVAHP